MEAHALVRALRDRGVDLATSSEAGFNEAADETQLAHATQENRVLLTYNAADFCRLHHDTISEGRHHAGIVIAEQQKFPVGEMMQKVLRLRTTLDTTTMRDRLEFLNRW